VTSRIAAMANQSVISRVIDRRLLSIKSSNYTRQ